MNAIVCRIALLLLLSPLCQAVQFDVEMPYGLRVREGGVVTLRARLKTTQKLKGRIVVRSLDYRAEESINVGQGEFAYDFLCPARPRGGSQVIDVDLIGDSGADLASKRIAYRSVRGRQARMNINSMQVESDRPVMLWIGKRRRKLVAAVHDRVKGAAFAHEMTRQFMNSHSILPEDAPENWRVYNGFHAVAVYDAAGPQFTEKQVQALSKWVQAGGTLVVDQKHTLAGYGDYPYNQRFPYKLAERRILRPWGQGRVYSVNADFQKDIEEGKINRVYDMITQVPLATSNSVSLDDYRELVREHLNYVAIPRYVIMVYLITFVLMATIVDRFALRKWKRLHWTWLTTSAVVVLFCMGASTLSRKVRGTHCVASTVTLTDLLPSGVGLAHSFSCFMPAEAKVYRLDAGEDAWVQRLNRSQDYASIQNASGAAIDVTNPVWTEVQLTAGKVIERYPAGVVYKWRICNGVLSTADKGAWTEVADLSESAAVVMHLKKSSLTGFQRKAIAKAIYQASELCNKEPGISAVLLGLAPNVDPIGLKLPDGSDTTAVHIVRRRIYFREQNAQSNREVH